MGKVFARIDGDPTPARMIVDKTNIHQTQTGRQRLALRPLHSLVDHEIAEHHGSTWGGKSVAVENVTEIK